MRGGPGSPSGSARGLGGRGLRGRTGNGGNDGERTPNIRQIGRNVLAARGVVASNSAMAG